MGKEVIYDAEHFFDGYQGQSRLCPRRRCALLPSAGADMLVLVRDQWRRPALGGGSDRPARSQRRVRPRRSGIHTHNDSGCGVANTLAAVRAGAVHVQGTINGYGERVGNANLCTIIPDLQLKMGKALRARRKIGPACTELSHFVAEVANLPHDTHQPYVGDSAFAHKGGIHVAAMLKNERSYQHIDPTLVGNQRRTVVSELSGRGNVLG